MQASFLQKTNKIGCDMSIGSITKSSGREILRLFGLESAGRLYFQKSALKSSGWFKSVKYRQSVDCSGSPEPWFTYPFLNVLKERIDMSMSLFEYGCGNSTLYYSNVLSEVYAVEHDEIWVEKLKKKIDKSQCRVEIIHEAIPSEFVNIDIKELSFINDANKYVNSISRFDRRFDIVVVDGLFRNSCLLKSTDCLSDRGVVILDNTHYVEELKVGCDHMKALGFKRLDFWGMCAIFSQISCTTIFYKPGNCFGI